MGDGAGSSCLGSMRTNRPESTTATKLPQCVATDTRRSTTHQPHSVPGENSYEVIARELLRLERNIAVTYPTDFMVDTGVPRHFVAAGAASLLTVEPPRRLGYSLIG
jgi:hypothetical protein